MFPAANWSTDPITPPTISPVSPGIRSVGTNWDIFVAGPVSCILNDDAESHSDSKPVHNPAIKSKIVSNNN